MSDVRDPFDHHPELRGKIKDPLESFFRTFRFETVLKEHPELEWVRPYLYTDDVREASRRAVLADQSDDDLWVFAYGSLMWDPAFYFAEVRRAVVPAYERRFILKETFGGRGSPEAPGLVAALDAGKHDGARCEGLAFRIPREIIAVETEILWRREYIAHGYIPSFVTAQVGDAQQSVLTFIADPTAEHICTDIKRSEQVEYFATGCGILGTSKEYLDNVVRQFDVLGVVDEDSVSLLADVEAYLRSRQSA